MLQVFRLKFSNYFNIWLLRRYFGGLNLYGLSMGAMGPGTFAPLWKSCKPSDAHFLEKLLAVLVVVDATVALVVE